MNQYKIAALIAVALLATGCTTTKEDVKVVSEAMKGSPKLRSRVYQDCIRRVNLESTAERHNIADIMNVEYAVMPATFCQRTVKAITAGRLTHDDYNNPSKSTEMVKVLQGR